MVQTGPLPKPDNRPRSYAPAHLHGRQNLHVKTNTIYRIESNRIATNPSAGVFTNNFPIDHGTNCRAELMMGVNQTFYIESDIF